VSIPVEESMRVAQLSGGSLAIIDGSDNYGDATQGIAAIETFVAWLPKGALSTHASSLTAREQEILRLVAAGMSNQQIADELVISPNTVRRHLTHIFDKTGVVNRSGATSYAHLHGLA
jgi:DNA-binding CsgD family transcriptional regulator